MTTVAQPERLDPQVENLLSEVRDRFRRYLWAQGAARLATVLAVIFWLWLAVDWLFEPPRFVRIGLLAAAAIAAAYLLYRDVLSLVFVRFPRRSMALLLERKFKDFDDSLLTAVELEDSAAHGPYERVLLSQARAQAARQAVYADAAEIFNYVPLRQTLAGAAALWVSIGAFWILGPHAMQTWFERSVLLRDLRWPRNTELVVVGFDADGRRKIARGSDFNLVVRASTKKRIPEVVSVRYWTAEGVRGRENMSREGEADPKRDPYQEYSFTFQAVPSSRELEIVGGDAKLRNLRLEVVDSPALTDMTLACAFPEYMQLSPRELPVSGTMQLPRGTQLTLRANATKPLASVEVKIEGGGDSRVEKPALAAGDGRRFELPLPALATDQVLLFMLTDTDGISNREPIRLVIAALADQAPQITVRPQGIGTAITPQARLPWQGKITDDYGVSAAWFETTVDTASPSQQPLPQAAGRVETEIDAAIEARDLGLVPGQKLQVVLRAHDNDSVNPEGPNKASGEKYLLDVVTPDELRAMLASRELNLRRRFETVIEEVTATRELLVRMNLSEVAAASAEAVEPPSADAVEQGADGADDADKEPVDPRARQAAENSIASERAVQNSTKNANETLGLATSFADICAELINNRVESEELMDRLENGISAPLRELGEKSFPELDARLELLAQDLSPGEASRAARDRSVEQVDAILREMQAVLDKMLELETYNEVVDLLRALIDAQTQVTNDTQAARKEELRDLLEEDQ